MLIYKELGGDRIERTFEATRSHNGKRTQTEAQVEEAIAKTLGELSVTTQGEFAAALANVIEGSLLNLKTTGKHGLPMAENPYWFHQEILTRSLSLWNALRDGDVAASDKVVTDMAGYLDRNPLTAAMRKTGEGSALTGLFPLTRTRENFWSELPGGVWMFDPFSFSLEITNKDGEKVHPIVDVDGHYFFLPPGPYHENKNQHLKQIEEAEHMKAAFQFGYGI